MAIKELTKNSKIISHTTEKEVEKFIAKGGSLPDAINFDEEDHRLTMRIPKWLMAKVDIKRKQRVGKISRNLWILEVIDRATKK